MMWLADIDNLHVSSTCSPENTSINTIIHCIVGMSNPRYPPDRPKKMTVKKTPPQKKKLILLAKFWGVPLPYSPPFELERFPFFGTLRERIYVKNN